jgi:hypothetical protein
LVGHSLLREGVRGFTVECVGARVPSDHLEAESGKARFQLTRGLLQLFRSDLSSIPT